MGLDMGSDFARLRNDIASFGWFPSLGAIFFRLLRRARVRVLKCVWVEQVPDRVVATDPRFECRFVTLSELRRWSSDPAYELDEEFLKQAAQEEHECFGILDGGLLVSYGWYSRRSTDLDEGWQLHFECRFVYMFKGFTLPAYRGQRLHAVGMGRALRLYRERGVRGIVSYVDAHNLASLKSCDRMGYQPFGQIWLWGRAASWLSGGCRAFGFAVDRRVSSPDGAPDVEVSEPLSVHRR
jgi:hypothetical protein